MLKGRRVPEKYNLPAETFFSSILPEETKNHLNIYYSRYERDVATMVRVIREFLKIPETTFTTQEILDVCGVLNVNAHEVPVTPTPSQALYANISILEHSCINNASKHFDGDNRVVIRAAVNIKKGEHISINYSDPVWGTTNRQLHLGMFIHRVKQNKPKGLEVANEEIWLGDH